MPRASFIKPSSSQLEQLHEQFAFLLSSLNSKDNIESFITDFFTKEEKIMLTKRLALFMMLEKGYNSESITSALHVSNETVRTYQHQLQYKGRVFKELIQKLNYRDSARAFFKQIEQILTPLGLALTAKTDMKSRAKLASGNW